jgi:hypothetical protein
MPAECPTLVYLTISQETTMAKGYAEALALVEVGKQMAMSMKPVREERTHHHRHKEKEVDIMALLEKKRRECKALELFVEEQHKLSKKEEKREEKKRWHEKIDHIALFLLATLPLNWGVLYLLLK